MPIPISISRPKLTSTLAIAENIDFGTAVIPGDDPTAIELSVYLDNLTIDVLTVAAAGVTYTTGSAVITGAPGDFSTARPGDVITSTPTGDFTSSQYVVSVAADGSSVTLDANPDTDTDSGGGGDIVLTPGDIDSTVYIIRLTHAISGSTLTVTPTMYCMDGTKVQENASADDADNATIADAVSTNVLPKTPINLDNFLSNARIARTN